MKGFTGLSKSYVFRGLLVLLIIALTVSGCAFGEQTPEPTEPASKYNNPMDLPEELLDAIVDFLNEYHTDHELLTFSEEQTIDAIKRGESAVHAAYDPSKYYFVCGYYKGDHEDSTESRSYCCSEEYAWVKFENADEIQEHYNDAKMAVAFQVNKALFVKDLLTGEKYSSFKENFQLYTPEFVDGLNTNMPVHCSETFIFVNMWNLQEYPIYYSTSSYYHRDTTWRCIAMEERYFMMFHWYHLDPDGQCTSITKWEKRFGKYCANMMNIMCQETYSVPHITGAANVYALIELNDFAEMVSTFQEE